MELRHLRYFIAVAEELHFARAAHRLGISQPPLSQQIQALEAEIGARLFNRTNRRVQLTESGRVFLADCRQILQQVDRAVQLAQQAHRGEVGELKVGFTSSAPFTSIIPSSIHAFRRQYPDVHLDLLELSSRQVVDELQKESVHIGVMRPLLLPDHLLAIELFREPLVAVLRKDHPLARHDRLSAAELAEEPFVFFTRGVGTALYDQVIALAQNAGFSPLIVQEVREATTIIGLVAAGLGVSILPASFRRTRIDDVVYRPLSDQEATSAVWLVRRQNERSPIALSFFDIVTQEAALRQEQTV